ncbi:MAG: hypothetical protein ACI4EX_13250 [Lachnospiraceae bacterium]
MELKTPYYVIDEKALDDNFEKLERALKDHWRNSMIGYSYKTNALPWIIRHFDRLGCYAEVVSEEEYRLAKLVGVGKGKLIYNGPVKTKETFLEAIQDGCIVNIDSQREIDWLDALPTNNRAVGIRINFDIERMCPGQSQCPQEGGRFGFCYENGEFSKAVAKLRQKNVRISGLHLHTSSKSRGLDIYRAIAAVACSVQKEFQFDLDYIDVGGGFFGGLPTKPQFGEYMTLLEGILSTEFDKERTKLIIEPGMAVIGAPVRYVTTVIDVKDTQYNRFVVTDGSRTSIDPLMSKSSYFHSYERSAGSAIVPKQIICGYTCMEHDRLFEAINEPALLPGDRIIYDKVGAYTMCLTPLFIKYFPDVYVERNGAYIKVREAWQPEDFLTKSKTEG